MSKSPFENALGIADEPICSIWADGSRAEICFRYKLKAECIFFGIVLVQKKSLLKTQIDKIYIFKNRLFY